ncbi:hypothetical protein D3C77_300930 [compost metagenome]
MKDKRLHSRIAAKMILRHQQLNLCFRIHAGNSLKHFCQNRIHIDFTVQLLNDLEQYRASVFFTLGLSLDIEQIKHKPALDFFVEAGSEMICRCFDPNAGNSGIRIFRHDAAPYSKQLFLASCQNRYGDDPILLQRHNDRVQLLYTGGYSF